MGAIPWGFNSPLSHQFTNNSSVRSQLTLTSSGICAISIGLSLINQFVRQRSKPERSHFCPSKSTRETPRPF